MAWNDWIYLGIGLGLGLSCSWWVQRGRLVRSSLTSPIAQPEAMASERQNLLERLEAYQLAYRLTEEMSQFKAGFLVRVSHELRSPLNSLIGLHQLILSDLCESPEEEREFITKAYESALKLVKLLDEILNVARTEHGTNQLEIQPLQLATVLQEVYQLTHLIAQNRNLQLRVSLPPSEVYILADPRWLRQVLVSLVDTSLAQMEEGSIYVSTRTSSAPDEPLSATSKLTLSEFNYVYIWLDVQVSPDLWNQEAVDLMHSNPVSQSNTPSLGLSLIMNQTLLELMKGRLEILPISAGVNKSAWTRIQLAIPLVSPEAVTVAAEGDSVAVD